MQEFLADLHIHSRFSRATSSRLNIPLLAAWAGLKGLSVLGSGDFTHPQWREELGQHLIYEESSGLYRLKDPEAASAALPELPVAAMGKAGAAWLRSGAAENAGGDALGPRFILQGEISSIYKRGGKVRKVHNLVFMPTLEAAERFSLRLAQLGNLHSDGRPILGLDSRDLLELVLEAHPLAFLVPAHIWTPWFSLFGSKSGFDRMEDCFGDLTGEIFALETGLSSDPSMIRLWSALDNCRLISNSDAHSGENLGREANVFAGAISYEGMLKALKTPAGARETRFLGTIEFFPEEGKYHMDGHRKCGVVLTPEKTRELGGVCPVCGAPLTVGVLNRVMELADRDAPVYGPGEGEAGDGLGGGGFASLVPLPEVLGEVLGVGSKSRKVSDMYAKALERFGPELTILRRTPEDDLARFFPPLGEAVGRMRRGQVHLQGGYDGEYGVVRMFTDKERKDILRGAGAAPRKKGGASVGLPLLAGLKPSPERPDAAPPVEAPFSVDAPFNDDDEDFIFSSLEEESAYVPSEAVQSPPEQKHRLRVAGPPDDDLPPAPAHADPEAFFPSLARPSGFEAGSSVPARPSAPEPAATGKPRVRVAGPDDDDLPPMPILADTETFAPVFAPSPGPETGVPVASGERASPVEVSAAGKAPAAAPESRKVPSVAAEPKAVPAAAPERKTVPSIASGAGTMPTAAPGAGPAPSLGPEAEVPLPQGLNPSQERAVLAGPGPVLVLAGPGTGKTRTLIARVLHLLDEGISARRILAVTFTRRAASEMDSRLSVALGPDAPLPRTDTLHALALEVWHKTNADVPVLLSEESARRVFAEANNEESAQTLREAWQAVNLARERLELPPPEFVEMGQRYLRVKSGWNLADYTDLLEFWLERITGGLFTRPWSHVLVDEVQDLSPLQLALARSLVSPSGEGFFGIGDPDQSIYSFRGAHGQCRQFFSSAWPGLEVISLSHNYRSRGGIIQAARAVLDGHAASPPLIAARTRPAAIHIFEAPGADAEAAWVADRIASLIGMGSHTLIDAAASRKDSTKAPPAGRGEAAGGASPTAGSVFPPALPAPPEDESYSPGDIAVLVRTHALAAPYRKALIRAGVPVSEPAVDAFWADERVALIIRAAGRMLGIAINEADDKAPVCPDKVLAKGPLGVAAYLSSFPPFDDLFWQSSAFRSLVKAYEANGGWAELITWIGLQDELELVRGKGERVQIISLHAAKGLEFRAVFLPCLEDGLVPFAGPDFLTGKFSEKSQNYDASEEQRLFYVGLTRAKDALYLSRAAKRTLYGRELRLKGSRFLDVLPAELLSRSTLVARSKRKEHQLKLL